MGVRTRPWTIRHPCKVAAVKTWVERLKFTPFNPISPVQFGRFWFRMYRDYNAALNILDAAGLAESLNAHGDGIRLRLASAKRSSRQGSANPTGGTLARSALGIPVLKHREEVNGADRLSIACRKPFATCRRPARTTVINLATRIDANTVSSSRFTLVA